MVFYSGTRAYASHTTLLACHSSLPARRSSVAGIFWIPRLAAIKRDKLPTGESATGKGYGRVYLTSARRGYGAGLSASYRWPGQG